MQFVLLIYQGTTPLPGTPEWEQMSAEEQQRVYADYAELNSTPGLTPGLPLGTSEGATTVRVEGGQAVTRQGPFAGSNECVGGYLVLEADDADAAAAVAARIPAARLGGAIEVRPVGTYW